MQNDLEKSGGAITRIVAASAAAELAKLRDISALTGAEAELLGFAILRMTYDEIAFTRGVSLNTVKSQMKALLSKLNVDRRQDIGQALAQLPGCFSECHFEVRLEIRQAPNTSRS